MCLISCWSDIPHDILVNIAQRVFSLSAEDIVALRGVCTSWRAATKDKFVKFVKSWPSIPLLMLAEDEGSDERNFYSLSRRRVCVTLPLPEAKGKRCIEVRFGWLLTLATSGEVALLNPFSRAQIPLPNFQTFPNYKSYQCDLTFDFIVRAVLSGNPSEISDFVVVVLASMHLGVWRHGDQNWRSIEPMDRFVDLNYYHQKLYAINTGGEILVWDSFGAGQAHLIVRVDDYSVYGYCCCQPYLVESAATGDLLLVVRNGSTHDNPQFRYGATRFRVFRIDVMGGKWEQISSFLEDAIFVGHNAGVSVVASEFPGVIKANCIYFSDDCIEAYNLDVEAYLSLEVSESESEHDDDGGVVWPNFEDGPVVWARRRKDDEWYKVGDIYPGKGGGKDMGVYNLGDGSIQKFGEEVETVSFTCPPLWRDREEPRQSGKYCHDLITCHHGKNEFAVIPLFFDFPLWISLI